MLITVDNRVDDLSKYVTLEINFEFICCLFTDREKRKLHCRQCANNAYGNKTRKYALFSIYTNHFLELLMRKRYTYELP